MAMAQRVRPPGSDDVWRTAAALAGVAAVTYFYRRWLPTANATTVSLTFLLVVLVVAATSRLRAAVVTSVAAVAAINFFFLPPVVTLTIADPQNWVALFVFLAVSLVASNLSALARTRTAEAVNRRDELARMFDLSRDVLVITESREAITACRTLHRAQVRPRFRRHRAAASWRVGNLHRGGADAGARSPRALSGAGIGAGHPGIRCLCQDVRRPPVVDA